MAEADMPEPMIQVRDLHHSYADGAEVVEVLHGIDLQVERGQFVAVMGPSGCGKTTLLHILGLITRPTRAARLRLDGVETTGLGDGARTELRNGQIGMVFQRFNLLPVLSAVDNVKLPLRIRGQSLNGEAESMLEMVGLGAERHRKPGKLSTGQQQRVAIARAMVVGPKLLLADEPTGNLDSENADAILELLTRCHREFGQTIVMVTHDRGVAERADAVLAMKDGRFREC
ncbi:MAG: ABC transporter ATP-binding protein [Phycisphaerales bacterium]|nr:MAG: ABC transporter ATP-binding protein [Phycisphaerales bacterium]